MDVAQHCLPWLRAKMTEQEEFLHKLVPTVAGAAQGYTVVARILRDDSEHTGDCVLHAAAVGLVDGSALLQAASHAPPDSIVQAAAVKYAPWSAFVMACGVGCMPVVRALLADTVAWGAPFDAVCHLSLLAACGCGQLPVLRELLALKGAQTPKQQHLSQAFIEACSNGHHDMVCELLALKGARAVDVHACNEEAFVMACAQGQLAVVRTLLALKGQRAVDVHVNNERPYRVACINDRAAVVRELLALKGKRRIDVLAECDGTGFEQACRTGNAAVVRELLGYDAKRVGQDGQFSAALSEACTTGEFAVLEVLLEYEERFSPTLSPETAYTALEGASSKGHTNVVRALLHLIRLRQIDLPQADVERVYLAAYMKGHAEVVQLLLEQMGNADKKADVLSSTIESLLRRKPRDYEMLRVLMEVSEGTSLNCVPVEQVLETAIEDDDSALVVLVGECVELEQYDYDMYGAIHHACEKGCPTVFPLLLHWFGSPDFVSSRQFVALMEVASEAGHDDPRVLRALINHALRMGEQCDFRPFFAEACCRSSVAVVREWLSLTGSRAVDIHANNNRPIVFAFAHKNFEVCSFLLRTSNGFPLNMYMVGLVQGLANVSDEADPYFEGLIETLAESRPRLVRAETPQVQYQVLIHACEAAAAVKQAFGTKYTPADGGTDKYSGKGSDSHDDSESGSDSDGDSDSDSDSDSDQRLPGLSGNTCVLELLVSLAVLPVSGYSYLWVLLGKYARLDELPEDYFGYTAARCAMDRVWRGARIAAVPIDCMLPSPAVQAGLSRHGRRDMLLHRHAFQQSRQAARSAQQQRGHKAARTRTSRRRRS